MHVCIWLSLLDLGLAEERREENQQRRGGQCWWCHGGWWRRRRCSPRCRQCSSHIWMETKDRIFHKSFKDVTRKK
ncbi:hypothetical protein JHK87_056396 [Glycine soja]|nr:hypothetical protein JHK87_056396 [Glycine soja]